MVQVYRKDLTGSYTVENDYVTNADGTVEFRDLAWYQARGYGTDYSVEGTDFGGGDSTPTYTEPQRQETEGYQIGQAMFAFLPESVLNAFAKEWVKSGDANIAIGATRNTSEWKESFGYLKRADGGLIMDEVSALSTIATYKQTLGEVGIQDFTDFEDDFQQLVTSEVSGAEFQQRIDIVYSGIQDQIPEVEKLFREQYNINVDQPTIFAALINPKIQDKVLAGDIATIQLQAEATSRGFSRTFAQFEALRKQGLTQQSARQLYSQAGSAMQSAANVGRNLQLETLEKAALGDTAANRRLQRIQAEIQSQGGLTLGAAKKGDEVTGLIEN